MLDVMRIILMIIEFISISLNSNNYTVNKTQIITTLYSTDMNVFDQ